MIDNYSSIVQLALNKTIREYKRSAIGSNYSVSRINFYIETLEYSKSKSNQMWSKEFFEDTSHLQRSGFSALTDDFSCIVTIT